MTACIICIDINTSAVKAHVYSMEGIALYSQKASYPTFHPQPDWSEQDPEQVFVTTLFVVKNLLNTFVIPQQYAVQAFCFTGSMHSVLPIDAHGVPLGKAIIWADNRGTAQVKALQASGKAAEVYRATGTPIHPMSPLMKIAWLKQFQPTIAAKTDKYISLKEYIIFQLTGQYLVDESIASSTGLFNSYTRSWETEALAFAGIKAHHLSEVASVMYDGLKLKKEYAFSWGVSENTTLILGGSDGCMATLGAGILGKKQVTVTIGASAAVRIVGQKPIEDPQARFFNYILNEEYYVSGGPSNNAGVVFDWFARQMGDFSQGESVEEVLEELFRKAREISIGADGLLFLPYLLGERAPIWNANARGVYLGLHINHQTAHLMRATLEGVLLEIYSIAQMLHQVHTFDSVVLNGSASTHPIITQTLADIFGKTIHPNTDDGVGTGMALLTLTKLGVFNTLSQAVNAVRYEQAYQPNLAHYPQYQQLFTLFEQLTQNLLPAFEQLATFRQA